MNHNEITSMAREAGLFVPRAGLPENGALIRFFHAAYAAGMGMTTLRTAAQQALEALEDKRDKVTGLMQVEDAITNLRAALAEPVQEPAPMPPFPPRVPVEARLCRVQYRRWRSCVRLCLPALGLPDKGYL